MNPSHVFTLLRLGADGRLLRKSFAEIEREMSQKIRPTMHSCAAFEAAWGTECRRIAKHELFGDAGSFLALAGIPATPDQDLDTEAHLEARAAYADLYLDDDDRANASADLSEYFSDASRPARPPVPYFGSIVLSRDIVV